MTSKSETAREKLYQDPPDFLGALDLMDDVANRMHGEAGAYVRGALWAVTWIWNTQGCQHLSALMKLHEQYFEGDAG